MNVTHDDVGSPQVRNDAPYWWRLALQGHAWSRLDELLRMEQASEEKRDVSASASVPVASLVVPVVVQLLPVCAWQQQQRLELVVRSAQALVFVLVARQHMSVSVSVRAVQQLSQSVRMEWMCCESCWWVRWWQEQQQ